MNITVVHPRHTTPRTAAEHLRIGRRYRPSARELFPSLRVRLLSSRPVIGERIVVPRGAKPNAKGVIATTSEPVFGKPTFRNVIEGGEHL